MQTQNILFEIKNLPIEELAKSEIILKELILEKKQTLSHILKKLPSKVSELIQFIRLQEMKVIKEIENKKQKEGRAKQAEIDEVLGAIYSLIPDNKDLIDELISAKIIVLQELFEKLFRGSDEIYIHIFFPLRKFVDSVCTKRREMHGFIDLVHDINIERDIKIRQLREENSYFALENKREQLTYKLNFCISNLENNNREAVIAEDVVKKLKDLKNKILKERESVFLKMNEIDKKIELTRLHKEAHQKKLNLEQEIFSREKIIYKQLSNRLEFEKQKLSSEAMELLLPVCQSYKEELEKTLIGIIEKKHPTIAQQALIYYPIFKDNRLVPGLKGIELLNFECYKNNGTVQQIRSVFTTKSDHKILERYKVISLMVNALKPKEPNKTHESFMDFCNIFHTNRSFLENDRDNRLMKLINYIVFIITFGYKKPKIKGDKVSHNIDKMLWFNPKDIQTISTNEFSNKKRRMV